MDSSKRRAAAHQGRPSTDFIRVDRFTEEERAQILAEAEAERAERAAARPDAWEELSAVTEPGASPRGGASRKVLVVLIVATLGGILALALLGLLGLGAWIGLSL